MLTYSSWRNAIKLQRAFGDVLTRDPSGTIEEQMHAEILSEEAIERGRNFPSESQIETKDSYPFWKKY